MPDDSFLKQFQSKLNDLKAGEAVIGLVLFASIINLISTSQQPDTGLINAFVAFLAGSFGDAVVAPFLDWLKNAREGEKQAQADVLQQELRADISTLLSKQDALVGALGTALQHHENSTVERVLRGLAGYQDFGTARIIAEIGRNNDILSRLDPEISYLTTLINYLQSRAGILQYVDLRGEGPDISQNQMQPVEDFVWDQSFSVIPKQKPAEEINWRDQPKKKFSSIREAVNEYSQFVLIGDPGAGKTTTLRRLALDTALRRLADSSQPMPLFRELSTWTKDLSLEKYLRTHKNLYLKWPLTTDIKHAAKRGDALLYIDGLNEMGALGKKHAAELRQWVNGVDAPQKIIVTCRAGDYAGDLDLNLPGLQTEPMDEGQIRQFAANYLHDRAEIFLKRVLSDDMRERKSKRSLFHLATNPYTLSALMALHRLKQGNLPRNTGALFRDLVKMLWEREKQRRTPGWVEYDQMEAVFSALAYTMIAENMPLDLPLYYALNFVGSMGLIQAAHRANLIELSDDSVRFYHQLVQEYFAAVSFNNFEKNIPNPIVKWGTRQPGKWDQVIIARCGIEQDASKLIELISPIDPILAGYCYLSGISISSDACENLTNDLRALLVSEQYPSEISNIFTFIGEIGSKKDTNFIKQYLFHKNDHIQILAAETIGKIGDTTAIPDLLRLVHVSKANEVRLAAVRACKMMGGNAVPVLLDKFKSDLRQEVIIVLTKIIDQKAFLGLVDALEDTDHVIRRIAVRGLAKYGDESLVYFKKCLNDDYVDVRTACIDALATLKSPNAVSQIIPKLTDQEIILYYWPQRRVCDLAAEALTKIATPEALAAVEAWKRGELPKS